MKTNRIIYLLLIVMLIWIAALNFGLSNLSKKENAQVINEYNINGFSTDFTRIVDECKPSIVTINADGNILSGFVYYQEKDSVYILTAYHGVSQTNMISVTFGSSYTEAAELVGHDIYTDLAVLRINTPYEIDTLKLGDSTLTKQGEFVICIGTPVSADYAGSVEMGMIAARDLMIENNITADEEHYSYYLDVIQLSADLAYGYSGSPLINMSGEIIGMNTMSLPGDFTFAITSNEIKLIADKIIAKEDNIRNILGIKGSYIRNMYNYEKTNLGVSLETINGIYVSKVKENTPAYQAGVRPGDVVLSINEKEINSLNDYLSIVHTPAEDIVFTYSRHGDIHVQGLGND